MHLIVMCMTMLASSDTSALFDGCRFGLCAPVPSFVKNMAKGSRVRADARMCMVIPTLCSQGER